jgi:uncharacterized protein (DUF58 family)
LRRFLGYALWSILLGVALLSPGMEIIALVPLLFIAIGSFVEPPSGISVRRTFSSDSVRTGGRVKERIEVEVGEGIGIVVLRLPLPRGLEGERTTFVFFARGGDRAVFERWVEARVPGRHSLPEAEVLAINPLFVRYNWILAGGRKTLHVAPGKVRVRFSLGTRRAVYMPTGALSTDFREVREYLPGDPLKIVNWKATARLGKPLVNEFERESGGTAFVVLDVVPLSLLGDGRFVELVSALVGYLTGLEYQVGFYLLGTGSFVPPSTGPRAVGDVLKKVLSLEEDSGKDDTASLIRFVKGYTSRYSPKVIFVTTLFEESFPGTRKTVEALRSSIHGKVIAVNVVPARANGLVLMENLGLNWELSKVSPTIAWKPEESVASVVKALSEVIA